jgi:cytochrome c-type biogenesis protein CcmH
MKDKFFDAKAQRRREIQEPRTVNALAILVDRFSLRLCVFASLRRIVFLVLAALLAGTAMAKEAAPMAEDLAIEKRMVAISEELRCLVCQNESLSGSHAELAQDLRREIRKMIGEGKTDQEILDFMVARYGDFVRYRPPMKPTTWLLWGGPFLLLAGGIGALIAFLRRRTKEEAAPALSDEEHRRAAALLDQTKS